MKRSVPLLKEKNLVGVGRKWKGDSHLGEVGTGREEVEKKEPKQTDQWPLRAGRGRKESCSQGRRRMGANRACRTPPRPGVALTYPRLRAGWTKTRGGSGEQGWERACFLPP